MVYRPSQISVILPLIQKDKATGEKFSEKEALSVETQLQLLIFEFE